MSEPWERQRGPDNEIESALWFYRWETFYRLQGPQRSVLEAVNLWRDSTGKERKQTTPGAWSRNAHKWHWKQRAEAWDEAERKKRAVIEEQERAEMLHRHVRLAMGMQSVGSKKLQALLKAKEEDLVAEVDTREARSLVKDGTAIERTARGLPEHLVAITEMTNDELVAKYTGLIAGVGSAGSGDEAEGAGTASDTDEGEADTAA